MLTLILALLLNTTNGIQEQDAKKKPSFTKDIYPVLTDYCQKCHETGGSKKAQNLLFDSKEDAYKAILSGKPSDRTFTSYLKAGKSDESVFYLKLVRPPYGKKMPAGKKQLTQEQVELIKNWIDSGAGK